MFCSKCGNELREDDAFCSKCGTKVGTNSQSTIHLVCQHCGSVMDYDDERQIVACPYCGSKELIEESDDVKIERIRGKTVLNKGQLDLDKEKLDYEREQFAEEVRQKKDKEDWKHVGIICAVCLIIIILGPILAKCIS